MRLGIWGMIVAIKGLNEDKFREVLRQNLTPSQPISSPEHLKGREKLLTQIGRAFNSPGKHVFIHGDRGVGKTSLAQTAAFLQQSSDAPPISVACSGATFLSTVRDALQQAVPAGDVILQKKAEKKIKLGIPSFSVELARSMAAGNLPELKSVNDAVTALQALTEIHSSAPVIIFDEFDLILTEEERRVCADIVKQVSDRKINVRFIICGIGSSLVDLIGSHLSTGRYLAPFNLERLSHEARWEILESAASAMGVEFSYAHKLRISQISDGFPSYVHLIGEQILWNMFDDLENVDTCLQRHFDQGVQQAINEAQPTLASIYDKATQKHQDDYQEVLWALADAHMLRRQTTEIYEKSYVRIMEQRMHDGRSTLTKLQFSGRLNNLKTDRHGQIIHGTGAGWYEFRENIVRGYVRLRAQNEGVKIGAEGVG